MGSKKKQKKKRKLKINPLTASVPHHIEASQLICSGNQLNGFYMMGSIGC